MTRFLSIAALGLALCAVSVPAQAGGGRASAQTFRAAAGCSSASAQAAGGYCPQQAAAAVQYRQQVIRQRVPVMTYQTVERVVEVPVPAQVVERQVYTYEAPVVQEQIIQREVIQQAAPAYVQQSSAAVGYGASASATVQQAAVAPAAVVRQRVPIGARIFGRRSVSKSRSVVRN
jgi:hypothetical protein